MSGSTYNFPNVERHIYDVDAFEILDRLREKYQGIKCFFTEHLLQLEEANILKLLNDEGYKSDDHQRYRNFILPSYYNQYNNFLAYKLLSIDLYKIEPFLSYQSVLFLGNDYAVKDNFIGLLEFLVYNFVQKQVLPNEQVRLEKIVAWLERNRVFLITKAYNEINIKDAVPNPPKRKVKMDPQFASILCEKLNCFFEGHDQALYNLIVKNEFSSPLPFNGQANQLAELFKRLRYNAKLVVSTNLELTQWLVDSFSSIDSVGNIKPLKFSSVQAVIKNSDKEPPKTKRILIDIAEYKHPENRKK